MMLYKNTKIKLNFLDGDTDYFDIVAGVLQRDILASYLFIICLDYVLRMSIDLMKENGFKLAKERSRRYPTQTIMDADYIHVNTDKTEYMCFNQRGDISTLKSGPLKLVDKFTYLGSSVSSAKKDINMQLAKAWTAIDRLSVSWKSDLTNKIKVFLSSSCVDTAIWIHYVDAN